MKKWTIITLFWLLLWQGLAMAIGNTMLLPSPVETLVAIGGLLVDSGFYLDALVTICRCLLAVMLSMTFGAVLAVAAYRWKAVRDILSLPISLFKTIPIMAVAIYMILLMSSGSVPVLVCWIMCFPIAYTNLLGGLDSMDGKLLEMAHIYGITGIKLIRHIYLPSLYPPFKSAMSLISGMSWKAIVTAEVLSIPKFSLGYELMNAKYYMTTETLFAYVVVIVVISVGFEKTVKAGMRALAPHSYEGSKIKVGGAKAASDIEAPRIELAGVCKAYGDKQVLDDFDLVLEPGQVTALTGPSGRGKTTVARIIAGLETCDSAAITPGELDLSFLFQEDRLIPWLSVYDNLAIVNPDRDRIMRVLEAVDLADDASKLPEELSGGMSYRVAMARAFIKDAGLLIADEPFRGLDAETKDRVINKLWKSGVKGRTVLLITHSDAEIADKVIEL